MFSVSSTCLVAASAQCVPRVSRHPVDPCDCQVRAYVMRVVWNPETNDLLARKREQHKPFSITPDHSFKPFLVEVEPEGTGCPPGLRVCRVQNLRHVRSVGLTLQPFPNNSPDSVKSEIKSLCL